MSKVANHQNVCDASLVRKQSGLQESSLTTVTFEGHYPTRLYPQFPVVKALQPAQT